MRSLIFALATMILLLSGASLARVRTLLFWNGGWQSLTNAIAGVGILVSPGTTALATVANLKLAAGASLTLSNLIGKVDSFDAFTATGTGLSLTADYQPV